MLAARLDIGEELLPLGPEPVGELGVVRDLLPLAPEVLGRGQIGVPDRHRGRDPGLDAAAEQTGHRGTLLAAFGGQEPGPHRSGLIEPLTERELEVLRLLAAGRSNAGMAAELFVEQSTVKTHLIHLYSKLGVHSRTQAVARARALGLLD